MNVAAQLFEICVQAIEKKVLIKRADVNDKEFHFQNWVLERLKDTKLDFDAPGRNSFPDFRMKNSAHGFEVKGLAYPGRDKSYDGNSQVPKGTSNGRSIFYIFGRYPKKPDGNTYPVIDLIICHGSFLNADSSYVHKNRSARGFGSYGDVLIRDRKMYVIPTPFALAEGLAHNYTLILPAEENLEDPFVKVGTLVRKEASTLLTSYSFNLITNQLSVTRMPNSKAGKEYHFTAWRLKDQGGELVKMRALEAIVADLEDDTEDDEENN
jgi:hypothetical protein